MWAKFPIASINESEDRECSGELRSRLRYAQIVLHFKSAKIVDLLSIKRYNVFQFSVMREVNKFIKRGAFVKFRLVLYRNIWVLVVQTNLRIGQRFWEITEKFEVLHSPILTSLI